MWPKCMGATTIPLNKCIDLCKRTASQDTSPSLSILPHELLPNWNFDASFDRQWGGTLLWTHKLEMSKRNMSAQDFLGVWVLLCGEANPDVNLSALNAGRVSLLLCSPLQLSWRKKGHLPPPHGSSGLRQTARGEEQNTDMSGSMYTMLTRSYSIVRSQVGDIRWIEWREVELQLRQAVDGEV